MATTHKDERDTAWMGDREGYHYVERGGPGYGEHGGGFGGGFTGTRGYGGGVSRGRERDLGWYRELGLGTYRAHPRDLEMRTETEGTGHRGKGPAGYRRADERILDDVCQALTDDDDIDASEIEVSVRDGEVILAGCVGDRDSKYAAEDLVERVPGVHEVANQLRVKKRESRIHADLE